MDVSFFSERSTLEPDMLDYGARKAFNLGNDGTFADRRPQSGSNAISQKRGQKYCRTLMCRFDGPR